jgi:hypothetical protein
MSPGLYNPIFVVFQSPIMRKSIAILAITLVPTLYSSAYNPALDCSDSTNMNWPRSGQYSLAKLESYHSKNAQSSRQRAHESYVSAKAKLPSGVVIKASEMAGPEIDEAKRQLELAKSHDLQVKICQEVAQMHMVFEEAALLRKQAAVSYKVAKSLQAPGSDMNGPDIEKAKRLLSRAKIVEQRGRMHELPILVMRASYDPKTAAEVAERLKAVKAVLASQ